MFSFALFVSCSKILNMQMMFSFERVVAVTLYLTV